MLNLYKWMILISFLAYLYSVQGGLERGDHLTIGGGYSTKTLTEFLKLAQTQDRDGIITIIILGLTYPSSHEYISEEEREINYQTALKRVIQLDALCKTIFDASEFKCDIRTYKELFIRPDCEDEEFISDIFGPIEWDGIFFNGGDQTVAMSSLSATLFESVLTHLHSDPDYPIAIAGTSAGCALQSRYMLAGYTSSGSAESGLQRGSIDVWYAEDNDLSLPTTDPVQRGFINGFHLGVIDQHFFQRGRLPRLIQATHLLFENDFRYPVGFGVDFETGAVITNDATRLDRVVGRSGLLIIDTATQASSAGASWIGDTLNISSIQAHVLCAECPVGFDFETLEPLVQQQQEDARENDASGKTKNVQRLSSLLHVPIFLAGDVFRYDGSSGAFIGGGDNAWVSAFLQSWREAGDAPLMIFVFGFDYESDAERVERAITAQFSKEYGVSDSSIRSAHFSRPQSASDLELASELASLCSGIYIYAHDAQHMLAELSDVTAHIDFLGLWHDKDVTLAFDGTAVSLLGGAVLDSPPIGSSEDKTDLAIESWSTQLGYPFVRSHTSLIEPLWPDTYIAPRAWSEYNWGSVIRSLVFSPAAQPQQLAYAPSPGAGLLISDTGLEILGSAGSSVMVIDSSRAKNIYQNDEGFFGVTGLSIDVEVADYDI